MLKPILIMILFGLMIQSNAFSDDCELPAEIKVKTVSFMIADLSGTYEGVFSLPSLNGLLCKKDSSIVTFQFEKDLPTVSYYKDGKLSQTVSFKVVTFRINEGSYDILLHEPDKELLSHELDSLSYSSQGKRGLYSVNIDPGLSQHGHTTYLPTHRVVLQ